MRDGSVSWLPEAFRVSHVLLEGGSLHVRHGCSLYLRVVALSTWPPVVTMPATMTPLVAGGWVEGFWSFPGS